MVRLVVGPRRSPRPDEAEPQHRPPREGGTTSDGGCIGSKPCSAWLEARLGSAQAPDRLGLDSRLGTRLETRFGSRPDSGSGTSSALFGNRLGSKRCSPRCLRLGVGSWLRLDSKLSPISLARFVSWLSSNDLGTRLVSVRFGTWGPARLTCDDSARFGSNCTIHVKRTRIINILIFNISLKIKWPKSEEKINFRGRWVWLSESSPTQNFVVTAWPWPHLCRPAAAASGSAIQNAPESCVEQNFSTKFAKKRPP